MKIDLAKNRKSKRISLTLMLSLSHQDLLSQNQYKLVSNIKCENIITIWKSCVKDGEEERLYRRVIMGM